MNSYAVIFTYNFDGDVAVYLFDDEEAAKEYLKKTIEDEYRIDVEENGWNSRYEISDDGLCGKVEVVFEDHIDVTEARIGRVYE